MGASRGVCKRSSRNSQRLLSQVSPHSRAGSPRLHFPRGSEAHCAAPEAQQESSELGSIRTTDPRDERLSLEAVEDSEDTLDKHEHCVVFWFNSG